MESEEMMTTISTKKSAKPKTPPPPTILTLTLNADGTGTLLTKRGDLACAHSFTYRDLKEIIATMQQSAAQLVEIEQNPPSDAPTLSPTSESDQSSTSVAATEAQPAIENEAAMENGETAETQAEDIDSDDAGELANTTLLADADDLPSTVNPPLYGVTHPADSVQMPLL
jgi:hypothetical protein